MGERYMTMKKRPPCDLCWSFDHVETAAYANAKVRADCPIYGWAYVCRRHFREQDCQIGPRDGMIIILPRKRPAKRRQVCRRGFS